MSNYIYKSHKLNSLFVNPLGIGMPLCTTCKTVDCTNSVQNKVLTILGVPTNVRLISVRNQYKMVVHCQGYSSSSQTQVQQGDVQGFKEQ